MPIKIPVVQTGLEASIQAAAQKAGKSLKINMGSGAKSIEGLSQPLGRITGKADQFTKSMEAANARVLAFGASVGVLSAVTRGFQNLVVTTIEVEKSLASINSILGTSDKQLKDFGKTIFDVAKNTEQSFDTVANAALELSRQGLSAEEVQKRLSDSLILTRLSGLGASEAVAGLTAAINSFNKEGLSSAEVLNKLSAAAVSAAVSERDLIEGIKRSGSVAVQAGVSFDELIGVITAVQKTTARGGAVIGNSFKTIFTRIQSIEKLETMQNLGVQVTDASGQVLGATKLIQNLAKVLGDLPDAKKLQIAEGLVGKFQIAPFLAILEDYNKETSTAIEVTKTASSAFNEAYSRNIALNDTLSASINKATVNLKELANTLGEIGVTDSLKNLLGFFNSLVGDIKEVLDGEGVGGDMARGIVKGISSVISGPGLAIFGAIILKLTADLARFGVGSLKTFFGLNKAAQQQATLQGQIASTLLGNEGIQKAILNIENQQISAEQKKVLQTKFFTTALNEQLSVMTKMQSIATRVAPGVMRGTRGGRGRAAGGFIPNYNAVAGYGSERSDISKGVGGAPSSARPVTIPNFNFGGGQKGTMVANSSEYIVPNFAGGDGSAIFNQNMVSSMGLPAGARKIGAAGGYIPNFAKTDPKSKFIDFAAMIVPQKRGRTTAKGKFGANTFEFPVYGIDAAGEKAREEKELKNRIGKYAISLSKSEAKSMTGGKPTSGKINKLGNQGAIGSLAGAVFETALSALLKSPDFDFGETGTFDYVGRKAVDNISQISPSLKGSKVNYLEAKIGSNYKSNNSMAKKIVAFFGNNPTGKKVTSPALQQLTAGANKAQGGLSGASSVKSSLGLSTRGRTPTSAAGYIPNFAGGLGDAIARESAAGLPINQIRINQDSSLKNAGNPMGLAITNTRDEPTGAIPNFADGMKIGGSGFAASGVGPRTPDPPKLAGSLSNLTKSVNQSTKSIKATTQANNNNVKGQRDMLGGIFATQIAFSALSGATSEVQEGFGRFVNRFASFGSSLTTAAFAGSAINDFGNSIGGKTGGIISKLGLFGAALGGITAAVKFGSSVYEDMSGITDNTKTGIAALGDASASAARKLQSLSQIEQKQLTDEANRLVGSTKGAKVMADLISKIQSPGAMVEKQFLEGDYAPYGGGRRRRVTRNVLEKQNLSFEGSQTKDILSGAIAEARAGGRTIESIEEELARLGMRQKGGEDIKEGEEGFRFRIDSEELALFAEFLKETNGLLPKLRTQLKDVDLTFGLGPNLQGPPDQRKMDEFVKNKAKKLNIDEDAARAVILEEQALQIKEGALKVTKQEETLERAIASIAKEKIKDAVERVKAETGVLDAIDTQILAAETRGDLTKTELNSLREQRVEIDANLKNRNATVNAVGQIVDKSRELTFIEGISNGLQEKLNQIVQSGTATEEDRVKVLEMANKLLEENDESVKAALVPIINALDREKDRVDAAKKLLDVNRDITFEITQQKAAMDAALIRSGTADENASVSREILLSKKIARGQLAIAQGSNDPLNINETRGRAVSNAISERGIASLENERDTITRERNQREQFRSLLENPIIKGQMSKLGDSDVNEIMESINGLKGGDIIAEFKKLSKNLAEFGERKGDKTFNLLAAEVEKTTSQLINNNSIAKQAADANLELADAAIKAAGKLGDLSFDQLVGDMVTNLTSPQNIAQARIDALTSTDPTARAKFNISEGNRAAKATALGKKTDQGLMEFADIVREEEFSAQLIDASAQFAQNIGNAMTQAIANGENLKDLLLGAASGFFNTLSQAFMQKAVNNIVSGFNAGGKVRGGSGNRDDVPALLTGGEFVMKKSSVNKYGSSFMAALNSGAVPTMQRGGLFTPGTYGQGAMKGKDNLLDFATQGFTTGNFDKTRGGSGFASVNLAPQSAALTMFGRRNSPAFQREQASKEAAFGLFTQQANKEAELKERNAMAKKGLLASLGSALFSFGFNSLTDLFSKKATGGSIPYTSGVDTVPTMLSGGEFVMNAAATQRIGRGNLNALNSGGGGGSGDVVGKLDELISVSDNSGETIINITVNSDGSSNSQGNGDDQQNSLATKIKDVVRQVIDDEKRLGGSLRQARA